MRDDNSKLIVFAGCAILFGLLGFIINAGACVLGVVVGLCVYGAMLSMKD
jgi:hypothetical protein